ncbi:DsbA family protein [Hyphococcus luteus]|uniref:2-hydroxychromene-2-carboxylate isomerase n=1 Tax=Hyphococcus luteus TaxID=2058213 RepID=A0A2S7K7U7_9PROT|nr:DsbA family protein [Marinicaulis flavus]PQA88570.1 disulfide bond formation protein DsbA [Marinicaulis flavus]
MAVLDIYWSFRSPYSYLAIDRLCHIAGTYDIETKFRPVRPLAMREPDFFERGRKQFVPYLMRDFPREAERLGLPFGLPQPDPIDMDMATGRVAADQPLMDRLMALGLAACEKGKGLDFAKAVSARVWTGKPWSDDAALDAAAAQAGLDLAELEAFARARKDEIAATIEANETGQLTHHWGVPLMVLDGEPFFGQDRLDSLVWRLDKLGLKRVDGGTQSD